MLVSLGLAPSELRLNPVAYELLALLPRLLKRHHEVSDNARADLKRKLTWIAMNQVLAPLQEEDTDKWELGYR